MRTITEYIQTKNLRECRFYWAYMKRENINLPVEPVTASEYCIKINALINTFQGSLEQLESNIKTMKQAATDSLLTNSELEWIDKGKERLCYWIWCYCRLADIKKTIGWDGLIDINLDPNQNLENNIYESLRLDKTPLTAKERYDLIVKFIDIRNADLNKKRVLLNFWKENWGYVYTTETFLWLDNKDPQQCEWAYSYLANSKEYQIPIWFIPTPTTSQQMYDATIAAFDIWPAHTDTKKMFIVKMKKAWSQKKHRDSQEGKKAYNVVMSTDIKKKLDALAYNNGMKKNEFIEWLINQEAELKVYSDSKK
ncbi:hypothetical protein [Psychromonas sp.]|uniref:hypothetical protein n=1 Tax=Psychromonas sp. TaxID=1884585 RepID=UPI00356B3374